MSHTRTTGHRRWIVFVAGVVAAVQGARAEWLERRQLIGTGIDSGDEFGEILAIDGDRLVVAARNKDSGGAVYVFQRNVGGPERWGEVALLPAPPEVVGLFGYTVDVDGDRIVAGSGALDDLIFDGAYVYDRQEDGQWLQVARLTEPPDPKGGDGLGRSVAVSGDTVFAANPYYDFSSGAVWVFERDAGGPDNWGVVARLDSEEMSTWLGLAVAADGNRLLAGAEATWLPDIGSDAGVAVLFERDEDSGEWTQVARLTASDAGYGDRFGGAVAISGDRLLIGAYTDPDPENGSGKAYIFERDESGIWLEVARLRPAGEAYKFGRSVSLDGNLALIASDNNGPPEESGVWIFERQESGEWLEVAKLNPADQGDGDHYGYDVAISGRTAVAGAPLHDDVGGNSGAAYVFVERDVEFTLTGACPGEVALELTGATARAPVVVLGGPPGETQIPVGPCAGKQIGLSVPMVIGTPRTDADGAVNVTRTLGPGACGHDLQVVDLATCALSHVVPIP